MTTVSKEIIAEKSRIKKQHTSEALTGWLMAFPSVFLIFVFLILPFFLGVGFSFTNQRLISPNPTKWVGLRNYKQLFTVKTLTIAPLKDDAGKTVLDENGDIAYPELRSFTRGNPDFEHLQGLKELKSWKKGENKKVLLVSDPVFVRATINTVLFALAIVPLQGGFALVLALLLNMKLKGINIFRTIFFMPVVVSMVVVSLLWRFIYASDNGLLNNILNALSFGHFQPVDWIGNPETALGAIIVMSIWQAVGFHMVIWLAGLQNIPSIRYEAASIDGANTWQRFWFITWPGLRNTAVFIFITITMEAFAVFTQIFAMTQGGPLDSTQSLIFQAVIRGYEKQDIAGGSTISIFFFMFVLAVSLIQRFLTREKVA